MPAPIFVDEPISLSPTYDKWLILTFSDSLLFLISTKFPTFELFPKILSPLILANGPIEDPDPQLARLQELEEIVF